MPFFYRAKIKETIAKNLGSAYKAIYVSIFDSDNLLDETGKKIFMAIKGLFHESSPFIVDLDEEAKIFLDSLNHKCCELNLEEYDKLSPKCKLEVLTETQSRLLWCYKGKPPDQPKELREDDYYNAKRYIGFLLADLLLIRCSGRICPEDVIDPNQCLFPEYIEYLQGISIEEYLKYKAYLTWDKRNKNNFPRDHGKENEDYFNAMAFLDNTTMRNCRKRNCKVILPLWKKIIEKKDLMRQQNILSIIAKAKKGALVRLFADATSYAYNRDYFEAYIDKFVDSFYNGILSLICRDAIPEKEMIEKIISSVYENPKVVNMFEFILKCFLVSKLSREEHDSIRVIWKKEPLEAICVM